MNTQMNGHPLNSIQRIWISTLNQLLILPELIQQNDIKKRFHPSEVLSEIYPIEKGIYTNTKETLKHGSQKSIQKHFPTSTKPKPTTAEAA